MPKYPILSRRRLPRWATPTGCLGDYEASAWALWGWLTVHVASGTLRQALRCLAEECGIDPRVLLAGLEAVTREAWQRENQQAIQEASHVPL